MPYEVVDPAEPQYRGPFYPTQTEAMVAASPGSEVWQLAHDRIMTRMVRVWPDPEFEPGPAATTPEPAPSVAELTEQADRYAADAMAKADPSGYAETLNVVALAYAQGRRDGFADCARLVGAPLTSSTERQEP